jgi:hypothetical protein
MKYYAVSTLIWQRNIGSCIEQQSDNLFLSCADSNMQSRQADFVVNSYVRTLVE